MMVLILCAIGFVLTVSAENDWDREQGRYVPRARWPFTRRDRP